MKKIITALMLLIAANSAAETYKYKLLEGVLTIVEERLNEAKFKKDYGDWSVNTMGWEGGKLPPTEITSIVFETKKQKYILDSSHMFNGMAATAESRLESECMGSYCTVRGVFSQGTAAYAVQWVMRDGVSRRDVLTSDPLIRNQIYKTIWTLKQPKSVQPQAPASLLR